MPSGQRMIRDQILGNDASADQMLLNDALEHRRIALAVPRAFGVDDSDRSAFADAKAVRFRSQNSTLLGEVELFQPALQKLPGREPSSLLRALRDGLIAAEEDVPPGHGNTDRGGGGSL